MIPIVKEEVKRIFHNTYGNDVDIERWVRCMVSNEIQRHGDYSMIRNLCREIIKEEKVKYAIADDITEALNDKLKGLKDEALNYALSEFDKRKYGLEATAKIWKCFALIFFIMTIVSVIALFLL